MKKLFLSTAIIMLNLCVAFAGAQPNSPAIEQDNITISIDLGDMTNMSEADLYNSLDESLTALIPSIDSVNSAEELTCTVTLKGSVGVGETYISIEVSVTGPCSEVKAEAQRLLSEIKQEVESLM